MKFFIVCAGCIGIITAAAMTPAHAHVLPWRDGESRQLGFGHCSKGPCTKRTCWAPSRPHRHDNGRVVHERYGGPECWSGNSRHKSRER